MAKEITLDEYKKAYRELISEEERRGFLIHLIVYILVNAMLITVNLVYAQDALWFFFPLLGWGIGLASHYLGSIAWINKELKKKEAEAEYRAKNSKKKK